MNQSALNRSRSDKFLFVFNLPKVIRQNRQFLDTILSKEFKEDKIEFTVFGSPVPNISVPPITIPFDGQNYQVSSKARPPYPPLNLRFLIDNGYHNYYILWYWLNLFNDSKKSTSLLNTREPESQLLSNPTSDYVTMLNVFGLDEYNNKIINFEYTNAFITGLSEINFNYQDPSEITCNASFIFNQLEIKMITNVNDCNICNVC
jgi:hypothetical protein